MEKQKNPLMAYMRRPKVFLKLPSKGKYWKEGSLDMPENEELPVYGLTARDELLIRTPDALFNGRTTVDVIRSCIPNIIDPWQIPSLDLDAVLIAIRIASYGEKMSVDVNIPNTGETEPFEIDLRPMLDEITANTIWESKVKISEDLTVYIEPVNYKTMTDYSLMSFDSNRLLATIVSNNDITEEQKVDMVASAMTTIADATLMQMVHGIKRIDSSEGSTDNPTHIREFLENIEKDVFTKISDAFKKLNDHNNKREITVQTPPKYLEQGVPNSITVPFQFDYSNFFV